MDNTEGEHVLGRELQVGDTILTWWQPGRDTITELRTYNPPPSMADCFEEGARLASFALMKSGMTIPNNAGYTRIATSR